MPDPGIPGHVQPLDHRPYSGTMQERRIQPAQMQLRYIRRPLFQ
jgi:hypothetical protein